MNKTLIFPVLTLILFLNLSVPGISMFNISMFNISVAYASNRTALVVGNSTYKSSPLHNPVNDASDIAKVLKSLGFDVILKKNADKQSMENAMRTFGRKLARSEIGLFYYAGHGMQLQGINYLIPVNNNIKEESEVRYFAVDAGFVLAKMEAAGNPLNIVILDACRDNPFKRSFRSSSKGLARMDAPDGTIIAYATKAGSVAEDGQGRNGTYTGALLNNISDPYLEVRDMFNKTGLEVKRKTSGQQIPWTSNDPFPDYYLAGGTATVVSPSDSNSGMLKISSQPAGADIFIHGKFRGTAPLEINNIDSGSYTIKAMLKGYNSEDKKVMVNKERKVVVNFYLDQKVTKARLYVTTSPSNCRVRILNINPAFYSGIELAQGRYKLEISRQGYATKVQWVNINSNQGIDLYVELEKKAVLSPEAKQIPGQIWREPVTGMEFVWVPKGCYQMGQTETEKQYLIKKVGKEKYNKYFQDELPRHEVCVDGFWMGKYEVTQGQYKKIMGSNPSRFKSIFTSRDDYPVEKVSWNDAKEFISKLNQQSGKTFKLPAEAQWEYAAKSGGKDQKYSGGNDIDRFAWYRSNSQSKTHKVGTKAPNGLGLYDMSGNVWEWCEDVYDKNAYSKHERNNPVITSGGSSRVDRGGCWDFIPRYVRAAYRGRDSADYRGSIVGFRLCFSQVRQ